MKKMFLIIMSLVLCCCTLTGCKSKEERELEAARKAADRAQQRAYEAQREYDELVSYLDELQEESERLANAK